MFAACLILTGQEVVSMCFVRFCLSPKITLVWDFSNVTDGVLRYQVIMRKRCTVQVMFWKYSS